MKCTEDFAISIVNTLFFHNHDLKPNEVWILAHTKYALKYQVYYSNLQKHEIYILKENFLCPKLKKSFWKSFFSVKKEQREV